MPGERVEDALLAARQLKALGVHTLLTRLGENISEASSADAITAHYLDVLDRINSLHLEAQISVKLTQLGLDLGHESCYRRLQALVERADRYGSLVWMDMEDSGYVDATLGIFMRIRAQTPRIGVCLQAYLHRTVADLERLLPLGPAIRFVKGAYQERPVVSFRRRKDVDENFFRLVARTLQADAPPGTFAAIATHDDDLVDRIRARISAVAIRSDLYEFETLYGINHKLQDRLRRGGERLRVLVSYGEYWFPWYMRRLAERPANVLFLVKHMF